MDTVTAESLIADGRGWDNKDRISAYDKLSSEQLIQRLGSWSPVVRERAAMALGRRKEVLTSAIIMLLNASSLDARYGACQALSILGHRAETAVEPLQKCLDDQDLWLRVKAADALAKIGQAAKPLSLSCWNCWRTQTQSMTHGHAAALPRVCPVRGRRNARRVSRRCRPPGTVQSGAGRPEE